MEPESIPLLELSSEFYFEKNYNYTDRKFIHTFSNNIAMDINHVNCLLSLTKNE